jgi:predicted nucleic acid-binding protein
MNTESVFIDSNVLLYWASDDATKAPIAESILAAGPILSVQVLNEFVAVSRRKHKRPWDKIVAVLKSTHALCPIIVPVSSETHELALRLAQDARLSIYDACIIAAAELAGCDVLYTEDLNHGQRIGRVTVRNPFA